MSLIITGGKIRVSSPKTGRVFGPLYEVMGWTPALVMMQIQLQIIKVMKFS